MDFFNEAKLKAITGKDKKTDFNERVAIVEDLDDKGLLIDFFMSDKEKTEFLLLLEKQKAKQHRLKSAKERTGSRKIRSGLKYLNIFSRSE